MTDQRRRALLTRLWVVAVLAWTVARAVVVWRTLGRYGVSPLVYAVIDLGLSVPYAVATARIVTSLLDRDRGAARRWAAVAAACFAAPDIYLLAAGHQKPVVVYVVVLAVAVTMGTLAMVSIVGRLRRGRAGIHVPSPPREVV